MAGYQEYSYTGQKSQNGRNCSGCAHYYAFWSKIPQIYKEGRTNHNLSGLAKIDFCTQAAITTTLALSVSNFVADYGKHSLNLGKGKHTSVETVTGIVSLGFVSQHHTAVVGTHREIGILLLEDTD